MSYHQKVQAWIKWRETACLLSLGIPLQLLIIRAHATGATRALWFMLAMTHNRARAHKFITGYLLKPKGNRCPFQSLALRPRTSTRRETAFCIPTPLPLTPHQKSTSSPPNRSPTRGSLTTILRACLGTSRSKQGRLSYSRKRSLSERSYKRPSSWDRVGLSRLWSLLLGEDHNIHRLSNTWRCQ
jgi:hypothetical protein